MDGIQVKCARPADREEWLTLVELVADNFPGLVMDDYARTLDRNIERGSALCVRLEGVLCGILLYSEKHRCLSCMAVHPAYRRRGVGRALVQAMLRRITPGEVSVTTFRAGDPKGDAPRALYASMGFEPADVLEEFGYPVQRFVRRDVGGSAASQP